MEQACRSQPQHQSEHASIDLKQGSQVLPDNLQKSSINVHWNNAFVIRYGFRVIITYMGERSDGEDHLTGEGRQGPVELEIT